ncbi:hypothetical protein PR202_ga25918 [Eleusine coracana subsp. coracana]|uniref:Formyl transferase N-terminal domain-containing protein n=1 Tax=Eleusine coracana subsp. coracana TaxID=191504 RepID=A0AAV5DCX0_ELECO|nr:hypothetical protein PR202_ga25918 [Eleusine coracana subsp. coracana]
MLPFARRPLSIPEGNLLGIHLFQCPDKVGIVAKLSECIASRGGNMRRVDVFVPDDKPFYYSRSEFTYNPKLWPRDVLHDDFLRLSNHFNAQRSIVRVPDLDPKYKISILASKQAFNAGVKLIGATSHFVTPELDAGPIIEQMVERVSHRDTLQSFVVKSENLEKQCLAEAIKSYCELRVLPYEQNKTVVF